MAMKTFGRTSTSLKALHLKFQTNSVWTIDLAHLLKASGLDVIYTTLTIGVNPGFWMESYYEQTTSDNSRVQRLFQEAEGCGIRLLQQAVSDLEIQEFLSVAGQIIIALVDKETLESGMGLWIECDADISQEEGSCSYTGHYIVVCGYDRSSEQYIIRDPDPRTMSMGFCCVSRAAFNAARQSFGTDEDLLFIQSCAS